MTIRLFGEVHSSKNHNPIVINPKTKKRMVVKNKRAKEDELIFGTQLNVHRAEWEKMLENAPPGPLFVVFYFHRKTRARWDFMNIVQGLADIMVMCGYLEDDDTKHFIPVWGGEEHNKDNPGVEFWIKA